MGSIGNTRFASSADLGAELRRRRRELGLTQQEVAETIGAARRVVGELERGKQTVRLQIAIDVAHALGLDLTTRAR